MENNKKQLIGKEIKCKNCGRIFIFTEGEQEFYKEKGFDDPKRCFYCRKGRKARKQKQGEL